LEGRYFTRVFFFKFCDIKNWHFRKIRKISQVYTREENPQKIPTIFQKRKNIEKKSIDFTFA
jgi:hypothetical protein